jgi:hypothetical protein
MPIVGDEEGCILCLVLHQEEFNLAPSPTIPRTMPLLKPAEPMEEISVEELSEGQSQDTWCQDMLHVMDEKGNYPSVQELQWDEN